MRRSFGCWTAIAAITIGAVPAAAQTAAERQRYAIEAQELGAALRAFSQTSGRDVIADAAILAGKRSARVTGDLDAAAALARLLRRTGLAAEIVDGGFVVRADAAVDQQGNGADIVVTGTRIRGAAPVGSPVAVIDRAAIERSGRGTVQSLFETIPSNFGGGQNEATLGVSTRNGALDNLGLGAAINLRGLGAAATLVLFEGNRPALGGTNGTFADISLIPQLAIDRIEVLTDGASAIYGTDAVAGVVNFRFRNRFKGAETLVRVGTADGDFGEYQLGQLVGARWGGGGVTAAYQYSSRDNLPGAERRFATSDLRPFGGPDFRSRITAPATIIAANGAIFGVPAGQDGRALDAAQLLPGVEYRRDNQREDDLLPQQQSHAAYLALDQEVSSKLSLYARAFYARRAFRFQQPNGFQEPVTVPVSNAFYVDPIGTREPLTANYNLETDFGKEYRTGRVEALSANGGAILGLGRWNIEASGNYGVQSTRFAIFNLANSFRLAEALADPDPATAFNVFGDGGDTNPATIARVRGSADFRIRFNVWSAALRADGPIVQLPTGMARLAFGAEHRDERIAGVLNFDTRGPTPGSTKLQPGLTRRDIDALYAELLVPLSSDQLTWAAGPLDLSIAGRMEWYSDLGQTFNPKVGLAWRPVSGLKVRGSYSTSFHAPGFGDLVGSGFNAYIPYEAEDPQSPTGRSIVLGLFGYADRLEPEKAKSWSVGFDATDWPVRGVTASMSYFDIRYRDRIATATSDSFGVLKQRDLLGDLLIENPDPALVQSYYDSPFFIDTLGVGPDAIDVIFNGLTTNLSSTAVRGIDLDLGYNHVLAGGTGSVGVSGTRLLAIDQRISPSGPRINTVGIYGNPVKLRAQARFGWSKDGFAANGFVNYVDDYVNRTLTPVGRVASWTTVDARVAYTFDDAAPLRGATIALSATNLFDRAPPFTVTRDYDKVVGYDPEQASAVGRLLAIQLTAKW